MFFTLISASYTQKRSATVQYQPSDRSTVVQSVTYTFNTPAFSLSDGSALSSPSSSARSPRPQALHEAESSSSFPPLSPSERRIWRLWSRNNSSCVRRTDAHVTPSSYPFSFSVCSFNLMLQIYQIITIWKYLHTKKEAFMPLTHQYDAVPYRL